MDITLKVKKFRPEAKLPVYAHQGDAGMDLFSVEDLTIKPNERAIVHTGIGIEYPEGYCTLIWDKSGMAGNKGIKVMGGVFEHVYKGEYKIILLNTSKEEYQIKKGQKIAQMLVQPIITAKIQEVQELTESTRGEKGFGSTGDGI